jgi:hypothetical protein
VRIAFFTETFLPKVDGIVTRLTKTLQHLVAAGDEVLIFCPEGAPDSYLGAKVVGVPAMPLPLYPELKLALDNPPTSGEKVKIFNQMTESHRVADLAEKVAALTGAETNYQANPRKEAIENDLIVDNRCFLELGLRPTTLDDGLLAEVVDVARRWADRCDRSRIPCLSAWTTRQAEAIAARP